MINNIHVQNVMQQRMKLVKFEQRDQEYRGFLIYKTKNLLQFLVKSADIQIYFVKMVLVLEIFLIFYLDNI